MRAQWTIPTLALSLFSAGCEHRYEALTAPPPGMTASLDNEEKQVRLSAGVALAFECFEGSGDDACDASVSTSNRDIAILYPTSLDTLSDVYAYRRGPAPRSAYVVVGIAPGETSVTAGGGSLSVTVLAPDR